MPLPILSIDDAVTAAIAFARNRFPGRDLGTESLLGKQARANAALTALVIQAMRQTGNAAIPSAATSSADLDVWAETLGLPTGTAGVYGRKPAQAATGGQGSVTGTNGVSVPDGTQLTDSTGQVTLKLNGGVTVPGSAPGTGSVTGTFDAVTPGAIGNIAAGQKLTWSNPPAGIDSTVTLTTAIGTNTPGVDLESDSALLARILQRIQTPPRGGSSLDFKQWAESQTGVFAAYPYPGRGGTSTIHVVLVAGGSGIARRPTNDEFVAVDNYINGGGTEVGQRPVTCLYKSMSPYMVGTGLLIRARVQLLSTLYGYDWDDTGGTYTVDLYTVGPPDTLRLNTTAPVTLTAAVDAGAKPRLQVLSTATGASTVPIPVRVTAYSTAGGKTTLTLENPLPVGWVAPNASDAVYAGGPVVQQTAQAIARYVDNLGPARGSYADSQVQWESDCRINRLTQIVLDQTDGNGFRYFKDIVSSGVTISYNGGGAAATDVTPTDATLNGPELLYLRPGGIAVTL